MVTKEIKMDESRVNFFMEHAGWSYDPKIETSEQGKRRSAERLAAAELEAKNVGAVFNWEYDDIPRECACGNAECEAKNGTYQLWICSITIENDSENHGFDNLGGIDLGADGKPCSDPYAKVIEAELAEEYLTNISAR